MQECYCSGSHATTGIKLKPQRDVQTLLANGILLILLVEVCLSVWPPLADISKQANLMKINRSDFRCTVFPYCTVPASSADLSRLPSTRVNIWKRLMLMGPSTFPLAITLPDDLSRLWKTQALFSVIGQGRQMHSRRVCEMVKKTNTLGDK